MQEDQPSPEIRKRLRAIGLSPGLIEEIAEDAPPVDLPRVCMLLEYGRRAARGSSAALVADFRETSATLADLTRVLRRTQRWYRGHVIGLESATVDELMPVYYATKDLLTLLETGKSRDPLIVIANGAASHIPRFQRKKGAGRPRRPWLADMRKGLALAGCSTERITELVVAAGFFSPARKS